MKRMNRAKHNNIQHTRQRGFTILELMVVVAIIALLAALIAPSVMESGDKAKVEAAKVNISNLMKSLKLYKLDNGRYPTAEQGLQALVQKPTAGPEPKNWRPYIDKLDNDPWGTPYQYLNPGISGSGVDVMSYGEDGEEGGEGNAADIGSWQ